MPQRRVLHLDPTQLAAYEWRGGTLHPEARFPVSDAGLDGFARYVREHSNSNFYLLADLPDEGFHFESVPYVQGADRRAMLGRKLAQYYYGSPFNVALAQGREPRGRRDERILFAALTRPQLVEPWLARLKSAEARLAGVFSVPLVGANLLRRIAPKSPRCVLVSIGRAGIRQSYFDGPHLRFSRLSPHTGTSPADLAIGCAIESAKIDQYLLSQRYVGRGDPLPVLVLVHPHDRPVFLERCRVGDELQFEFVDLHGASRACGLKSALPDSFSDALFMHMLVQATPRDQFAPPPERRFYRIWQTRTALLASGAVALAGCLLFAGRQYLELDALRDATGAAQTQARADAQRHAEMIRGLPPMPVGIDSVRAVVAGYAMLDQRSAPPEVLLGRIGAVLQASPRIELQRIDWMLSTNPEDALDPQDLRRGQSSAAGESGMFGVAILHAAIPVPPPDPRAVLETINGFAGLLREDASLRVAVLRLPLELESGKALRGGTEAPAGAEPARFSLRVSYKL